MEAQPETSLKQPTSLPWTENWKKFGLEVQLIPNQGRSLVAQKAFKKGSIIFSDDPIHCCSFKRKVGAQVCGYCLKFVGTLNSQFGYLSASVAPKTLPGFDPSDAFLSPIVPCDISTLKNKSCQEVYCSPECKQNASRSYHKILCPDYLKKVAPNSPLFTFDPYVEEEDLEHYKTALKIIINLILEQQEYPMGTGSPLDDVGQVPSSYVASPLRNILPLMCYKNFVQNYEEDPENEFEAFQKSFIIILNGLQELQSVGAFGDLNMKWFDISFYGNLLGLLRLNSHVIKIDSPLREYIILIEQLPTQHRKKAIQLLLPLVKKIQARKVTEEDSDSEDEAPVDLKWSRDTPNLNTSIFPGSTGMGLFPKLSMINHSCDPNCKITFFQNHQAVVMTKREIAPGEQLSITYTDDSADYATRQQELKDYSFTCQCTKCSSKV